MLNRIYMVAGGLIMAGFAWTSWAGWEFGGARASLPVAGAAIVRSRGNVGSGGRYRSSSRSGWGVFGGK